MENEISNAAVPARASRRRKAPAPFRSHRPVAPPQVSPTANVAAVLSETRGVTVVGVGRTARPPLAVPLASAPQACAWSDGGECLVVGDSAGALYFVDAATGAALLSQPLAGGDASVEFCRIVVPRCVSSSSSGAPSVHGQLLVLERSGRLHRFAGIEFGAIRDAAREDDRDALRRAKGRITCALSTVGDERSVPVDMQATVRQHRVITFVAASGSGAFAGVTAWSLSCGADAASKQPRKVDAARPAQLGGEPVRLCLAGAQREWLFALSSVGVMTWWKVNSSSSSGVRLAKLGQWDGGVLRSDAVSVAPTISDCAPLSVWRSSGGGDADDSSGGVLHLALQTTVPARVYVVRASVARPDRPECIGEPHTLTEDVSLAVSSDGGIHTVRIVRDGVALDRVMESPAGFAAPSESGALEASGDVEQLRARLLAVNALAADEEELASILADLRALLRTSAARGDRILAMRVCKAVRPVPIETVRKFVDIVRSVVDLNRDESDEAQQLPAKLRDGVVAVLRRWTTFELLASVVRCASGDPVATLDGRYWTQFRDAPLHNVVAKILSRGSVSWAQLVWRRHCEQDEGQQLRASIVDLLSSLPHTAAVATAATRWLRSDVIPHLASAQLRHLATWLDMRARELESEGDDCRAALEVAGVLSEFEEKISTSKSSAPTATTVGGTMSTPANEVQMYVRAMQVAGCEVKSEMRKLFDLHRALRDQAFLLEEMGVDIALESIEGVTPVKIAGRVFDQMCNAESSLTCKAAMARALRYCSRHNLQTDDVIETYIKEVLMRAEFSSSSLVHRRVIATLYCIESIQTRFAAALLVLRAARAPFGEEINELLRVCSVWATATSQIETLREQQQLMALHGVLARHRLDPDVFNIADSNSARLLLSHLLTCVEDDSSLADGLIVAAAYDDLSRTLACAVFLENLSVATPMDHNLDESVDQRVARCVTLLRSFELTEQRIIGRRVVNFCLSTLLECEFSADDELRCQQRWAERVSVALAAAFLREVIRSGDESDKAVDSALLHDVEVIACLQSEFDVFLSVESLQSDFHCERILDWVMQPFVAQTANGDASSFSTTPNIVVEKMELRPLTSITQLFRIGELLGVCRTSMQGELARQLGLHGDVGAAVEWCDEVCRDHDSSESHAAALSTKVLRDTSVALIEFVARNSSVFNTQDARFEARGDGRSGSRTQASAASSQSRIPLFVRQLLMQTVALCPDSELVSVVDLAAKAELVAAIFSECELGEYHCLWEKQSSHLHEPKVPGRLAHYHAWFREAALVLNTQSAMELAFAYSFASTRNLLSCGQTLVDHLQENGFEQLALRVLGHCLAISPSINSADGCTARIFGSMLTKALCSKNQVDIDFSLSCMLSMPKKEAKSAYHEALLVGSIHKGKHRDFQRLESLGHLGRRLGTTWQDEQRRSKGEALARHARWWHRLTEFGIDFNHLAWWGTWQKLGQSATFAKNLLGELLLRSNNNLELAKSFARSFQIAPSDPLLMFIEAVAQEPNACNSEAQRSAIEDAIESTLSITTACHSLDFLLERLVGKIAGDDYESLLFLRTMQVRARVRLAEEEEEEGKRSSVAEDDDVDIDEEDAKDRCAFSRRHALVLRILLQWRESASAMDGSTKLSYHDLFSTPASPSEDTTSSAFSLGRSASSSSSSAMNWDVLKAALSVENVKHLIPLHAPLQLDSDRFYVCLLDRMIPSTVLASAEHVNKALTSTIKSVCDLLTRIQRTATAIRTAKQLVKQWPKDGSKIFLLEQVRRFCLFSFLLTPLPPSTPSYSHHEHPRNHHTHADGSDVLDVGRTR